MLSVFMSFTPCILQIWFYILQSKKDIVIQNTFVTIHFAAMHSWSSPYSGWYTQGIHTKDMEMNIAKPIPP